MADMTKTVRVVSGGRGNNCAPTPRTFLKALDECPRADTLVLSSSLPLGDPESDDDVEQKSRMQSALMVSALVSACTMRPDSTGRIVKLSVENADVGGADLSTLHRLGILFLSGCTLRGLSMRLPTSLRVLCMHEPDDVRSIPEDLLPPGLRHLYVNSEELRRLPTRWPAELRSLSLYGSEEVENLEEVLDALPPRLHTLRLLGTRSKCTAEADNGRARPLLHEARLRRWPPTLRVLSLFDTWTSEKDGVCPPSVKVLNLEEVDDIRGLKLPPRLKYLSYAPYGGGCCGPDRGLEDEDREEFPPDGVRLPETLEMLELGGALRRPNQDGLPSLLPNLHTLSLTEEVAEGVASAVLLRSRSGAVECERKEKNVVSEFNYLKCGTVFDMEKALHVHARDVHAESKRKSM